MLTVFLFTVTQCKLWHCCAFVSRWPRTHWRQSRKDVRHSGDKVDRIVDKVDRIRLWRNSEWVRVQPFDFCRCVEHRVEKYHDIFENIKISKISKNHYIFDIFDTFDIFDIIEKMKISNKIYNKCVSRTDTNPPFAFQTAFPRGTDFSVSTGRVKKLRTLLVSLYF